MFFIRKVVSAKKIVLDACPSFGEESDEHRTYAQSVLDLGKFSIRQCSYFNCQVGYKCLKKVVHNSLESWVDFMLGEDNF